MIKKLFISLAILVSVSLQVHAIDYNNEIENIVEKYNTGVFFTDDFTLKTAFDYVKTYLVDKIEEPVNITSKIAGIIILCAVVKAMQQEKTENNIVDIVAALLIYITLLTPVRSILVSVSEGLVEVKNFMVSFLPVFGGISLASGEIVTSSLYTGIFLSGMIFASNVCIDVIMPSVNIYLALIASDAVSPYIRLKNLGEFYIKTVRRTMRSMVSVICFLLTFQTVVSQGKDTLAVKTGKFLTGSAIPVIGSVLQDAVGSVFAGMEAIKGFAGAAGIAAVVAIFLPVIAMLICYMVCVNILYLICDVLRINSVGNCIKGFVNIIELMISIVLLIIIMLVFSLAIMISMTNGV